MGKPAARVGDMFTHMYGTGSIVMGSTKVIIGGSPAATVGSSLAPSGSIVMGSTKVFIDKKPAAFLSSDTACVLGSGKVIKGHPKVLIG